MYVYICIPIYICIHSYIYIHIYISSCRAGSTDIPDTLATFPYRSSPQAGLQENIMYPHIVAECMFVLVVLVLHGHVWGSISPGTRCFSETRPRWRHCY